MNSFNLNLIPLDQLHEWERNKELKTISFDAFQRLKKQMRLGQHSTLLVMKDGTVIGGNSRIKAMRELKIPAAKCIILDFVERADDFVATLDGEIQLDPETKEPVAFPTLEDGKMAYAMSHNDEAGHVNQDGLINLIPEYNLDWSMFGANFKESPTVEDWANFTAPGALDDLANIELPSEQLDLSNNNEESNEEKSKDETQDGDDSSSVKAKESPTPEYKDPSLVTCPDCGATFDSQKHKARKGAKEHDVEIPADLP